MDFLRVKGYDKLIRDPRNNSIINTNDMEYNDYLSRKKVKEEESQKIQNLETDVANIKENIDEIKFLLRRLLNES
jgi:hypothetical protein